MKQDRVLRAQLQAKNRMSNAANDHVYDNLPRLTPGQIETLRQRPDVMDLLVKKLGLHTVQVMMGAPNMGGLVPETQENANAIR